MNKSIKSRWIGALRSGRYAKRTGRLRSGNLFDVFGVLCDTLEPDGWKLDLHRGQVWIPDPDLLKKAGLDTDNVIELLEMNDWGLSFEQLADHIGKCL